MYVYNCIIKPVFDYAITLWGYTCKINILKVQRLQNRAARIVTGNFDYINVRGIDLVIHLNWMNIEQRRHYVMALLMLKCIHNLAPT